MVFGVVAGLLPLLLASCTIGPCGVTWLWSGGSSYESGPATNLILAPSQYNLAEVIYRNFLPGEQWPEANTNSLYCLAFGDHDATVPADFMARFVGAVPRVFTGTNGLIFGPGVATESESGRNVVRVTISTLSTHGDKAEARVFYIAPSMVADEKLQLAQAGAHWSVTKRKELMRSYF